MTTTLAASGLSATGGASAKRLKLLIFSAPKSGKTVLAHSMPRTRTLDFNDGMQSVEWAIRAGVLKKKTEEIVFEKILSNIAKAAKDRVKKTNILQRGVDQVETWIEEEDLDPSGWDEYCLKKHKVVYPQMWNTLVIDSGTDLTKESILVGLQENQRLDLSKSFSKASKTGVIPMRSQDWGSASSIFMQFLNYCLSTGKNVVLICHEYINTDEDGNVISYEPKLIGQLRQDVPGYFDEVWYMAVSGTRDKPNYEVQTSRDSKRNLGSRLGCLDAKEPADFIKMRKKVAKFYEVPEEKLWSTYHGTAGMKRFQDEENAQEGAGI